MKKKFYPWAAALLFLSACTMSGDKPGSAPETSETPDASAEAPAKLLKLEPGSFDRTAFYTKDVEKIYAESYKLTPGERSYFDEWRAMTFSHQYDADKKWKDGTYKKIISKAETRDKLKELYGRLTTDRNFAANGFLDTYNIGKEFPSPSDETPYVRVIRDDVPDILDYVSYQVRSVPVSKRPTKLSSFAPARFTTDSQTYLQGEMEYFIFADSAADLAKAVKDQTGTSMTKTIMGKKNMEPFKAECVRTLTFEMAERGESDKTAGRICACAADTLSSRMRTVEIYTLAQYKQNVKNYSFIDIALKKQYKYASIASYAVPDANEAGATKQVVESAQGLRNIVILMNEFRKAVDYCALVVASGH